MVRQLLCYAEGQGDQWQSICVDLDLAVQGRSFHEVQDGLDIAIAEYIGAAADEDAATRQSLLNRRAPLLVRLQYAWRFFKHSILLGTSDRSHHGYQTACPA